MLRKKPPYQRIAITLPAQDLAAADRLAHSLDRSRSWVVAEAIRRYAEFMASRATENAHSTPPLVRGLGASRSAQLTRDLSLTPEQRVREAEETMRLTEARELPRADQIVAFDRYEDYAQWKRRHDRTE